MVSFKDFSTAVILASSFVHPAIAMWPNSWVVGNTCLTTSKKNFDSCNNQDMYCLCRNRNFLASAALCIRNNLQTSDDVDQAWDFLVVENCKASKMESDLVYKSSLEYLNKTKISSVTKFSNYSEIYTTPIFTNREIVRETYTSIYLNLHNRDVSTWQGSVLVMIWVVVMSIAAIYRFLRYLFVTFGSREQSMGRPNKLIRLYYQYISIPAVFDERHIDRYYLFNFIPVFFPTRFESIVIAFYFLMNVIFLCTGYSFMNNNPLWATHYSELVLNLSNRAGIFAAIQVPLLTLFALRNNVLIWLTGWSFSTFNAYHRAVARVTFLLAVVHAASKHTMMQSFHAPLRIIYFPTLLFRLGVAAISLWSLMIILGFFRVKYYEIFLFFHVGFAIASYFCILFHLNSLGYKQTIYVSLGLLCGDFLIRAGRIIFSNFSFYLKPILGSGRITKASVSLLPSDVINVRIRTPIQWPFAPGQYVYIHFNRLKILESHPFSAIGPSSDGESFQLLCKARNGITRRLKEYLETKGAKDGQKVNISVLIEGPYGVHCPVERYNTVLLVAGGIGITGIIPYAEYLALSPHYHEIHLIWTVAAVEELTWIEERIQWLSETGKARIKLYVTRSTKANPHPQHFEIPDQEMDSIDLNRNDMYIGEDDNRHLVGNEPTAMYDANGINLRKKLSIKKHIRSLSHSSNLFQVELDERMENVDGDQMVDWSDDNPEKATGLRRKISHLSHRSRSSQNNIQVSEKTAPNGSDTSKTSKIPRESLSNYNSNARFSYLPNSKTGPGSGTGENDFKSFNKQNPQRTNVRVQELSSPQF